MRRSLRSGNGGRQAGADRCELGQPGSRIVDPVRKRNVDDRRSLFAISPTGKELKVVTGVRSLEDLKSDWKVVSLIKAIEAPKENTD